MESYYIHFKKRNRESDAIKIVGANETDIFRQASDAFRQVNDSDVKDYVFFEIVQVDEDEHGWLGVLYQLQYIYNGEILYYFPAPDFEESFFGSESPCCVDAIEMLRLFTEWVDYWEGETVRGYLSSMNLAFVRQIEKYGVYRSQK